MICATGKKNKPDEDLDEESAAGLQAVKDDDALIDSGIDDISQSIDRLGAVALSMKEEVSSEKDIGVSRSLLHVIDRGTKQEARQDGGRHANSW